MILRNDAIRRAALAVVARVERRTAVVLLASVIVLLASGFAASRLSLQGDFSALLPPTEQSVRHLRALEARTLVPADFLVGAESDDPVLRARAGRLLLERIEALGPEVGTLRNDRAAAARFAWKHRFLYAPLGDLEAASDQLERKINEANPMYISLDDDDAAAGESQVEKLRVRLDEARAKAGEPPVLVSDDKRLELLVVRTPFTSGDIGRGRQATRRMEQVLASVRRDVGPGVSIGMTGDVITMSAEHSSLLNGMLASTLCTVLLVVGALALYYRTLLGVGALFWSLAVGAVFTFGLARLIIGHLNLASAFLSSIVIGNGINFGILLLARYLEERRAGNPVREAVRAAMVETAPGTITAALAATIAYGSLMMTPFRGFRDFGIIGALGMVTCWISAYTVFPALLFVLGTRIPVCGEPAVGPWLARIVPARPRFIAVCAAILVAAAAGTTLWFLLNDPFENNLKNLRSDTPEIAAASAWMDRFDKAFGHGISGGFVMGVSKPEQAKTLVASLRAVDEGKPKQQHLFSHVGSIDDLLPSDQTAKLAILENIRRRIGRLPAAERKGLADLRPPDDLRPVTQQDVPAELAWPFTERDGTRGRLVIANMGLGIDSWNLRDLVRFAASVRQLSLGADVLIGGSAFVFSDMLAAMKRDGPRATLGSLVGACLVVLLLVGIGRHGWITLACGAMGTLLMLSVAFLSGLRVNFLDFVALPITIGIGMDYAVNIVVRERQDPTGGGRRALSTTGGAVLLCSFTTIVGYASLLFSRNQGIHAFGLAAVLGEITCLTAALVVAPALLDLRRPQARTATTNPPP